MFPVPSSLIFFSSHFFVTFCFSSHFFFRHIFFRHIFFFVTCFRHMFSSHVFVAFSSHFFRHMFFATLFRHIFSRQIFILFAAIWPSTLYWFVLGWCHFWSQWLMGYGQIWDRYIIFRSNYGHVQRHGRKKYDKKKNVTKKMWRKKCDEKNVTKKILASADHPGSEQTRWLSECETGWGNLSPRPVVHESQSY